MLKKDLEAEVKELYAFIGEINDLAKLALKYNKIGPGYIEEILEKLATRLPKEDDE